MAFPVFSPQQVNLNAPDPRLMVTDWAGAFNRALESGLNAYVKMKGLGLEERYKQHIMEKDDLRFQLDQRTAEAKMENEKMQLESTLLTNEAVRKANETAAALHQLELENGKKAAEATALWAKSQPTFQPQRDAIATIQQTRDPIAFMDEADKVRSNANDLRGNPDVVRIGVDNTLLAKDMDSMLFPDTTLNAAKNAPRYEIDEMEVVNTITSGDPALIGKAMEDLTPERAELATTQKVQTRKQTRRKTISQNELEQRVRAGDGKAFELFVNSSADKKRAVEFALKNTPRSVNLGNTPAMQKMVEEYGVTDPEIKERVNAPSDYVQIVKRDVAQRVATGQEMDKLAIKDIDPKTQKPIYDSRTNRKVWKDKILDLRDAGSLKPSDADTLLNWLDSEYKPPIVTPTKPASEPTSPGAPIVYPKPTAQTSVAEDVKGFSQAAGQDVRKNVILPFLQGFQAPMAFVGQSAALAAELLTTPKKDIPFVLSDENLRKAFPFTVPAAMAE